MTRELVYFVAASLDGRISGPHDDWSAFPMTGDHFAHLFQRWPDTLPSHVQQALGVQSRGRFDTVLMGWNTYAVGLPEVDSPYRHLRQLVFSRQSRQVGEGVELIADDPATVVRELKSQPGADLWLCGGGRLAASLHSEIDRLVLKVQPVTLNQGPTLFEGTYSARQWHPVGHQEFDSGVSVREFVPVPDAAG